MLLAVEDLSPVADPVTVVEDVVGGTVLSRVWVHLELVEQNAGDEGKSTEAEAFSGEA